jgi:hypothetical protein
MTHDTQSGAERPRDGDAQASAQLNREVDLTQPGEWFHVITPEGRIRIRVMVDRVEVESDEDLYILTAGRLT